MSEKKKELLRTIKFVLFSISAGVIQVVSFTILEEVLGLVHSENSVTTLLPQPSDSTFWLM